MQKIFLPIFLILNISLVGTLLSQNSPASVSLTAEELQRYKEEARQMVSFLQFTFNTLGSRDVSTKEKDIIINQSWSKIFENEKVQIEDDLDENREFPINKDVQAYLKDIDFFFQEVTFTFTIQEIEQQINEKNQIYFRITTNRNLKGTTIDGLKVDSNKIRYIEINLDDRNKELKIASIYTTKLNEKEELRYWWANLDAEWRKILGKNVKIKDTLLLSHILWYNDEIAALDLIISRIINQGSFSDDQKDTLKIYLTNTDPLSAKYLDRQLLRLVQLDTIRVGGNRKILSLDPLSRLTRVKYLDFSNTPVISLMPIRNLSYLEYLNAEGTYIDDADPIRYLTRLREINFSNTRISELEPLGNLTELQRLNLSNTPVYKLDALGYLNKLRDLDISGTKVVSITPISGLTNLDRLDISRTFVSDISVLAQLNQLVFLKMERTPIKTLEPLRALKNLNVVFIDHTPIADLTPLNGLPNLIRIYCDQTRIGRSEAIRFMENNPRVLVIYETEGLVNWWNQLSAEWKKVFSTEISNLRNPDKEELHNITRLKILNIAGNKDITHLQPVTNLPMLNTLLCQGTSITDITPLGQMKDLQELNISETMVSDLTPLKNLLKLEKLLFDNTPVQSIAPLMRLRSLRMMYCDNTKVQPAEIIEFQLTNPDCLVIYQTRELQQWWNELPEVWKFLAEGYILANAQPSREQLHEIASMRIVNIDDSREMAGRSMEITSLEPLRKMVLLEYLKFSNTSVTSLDPLSDLIYLKTLICPNNPVVSLAPLSNLTQLEVLDIQNTPVRQLNSLSGLRNLKKLHCSGTQIKNLKGLELLINLEQIDCFNTRIRNLKPLENLPQLKLVRCYNTRITPRAVAKFKAMRPGVEVVYY